MGYGANPRDCVGHCDLWDIAVQPSPDTG